MSQQNSSNNSTQQEEKKSPTPLEQLSELTKEELEKTLFLVEYPEFREVPCRNFDEFLDSYIGIGDDIYPEVRKEGNEIVRMYWEYGIKEAILYWGIGSGKSTLSSIMTVYLMHLLLCLEDPHNYFDLMNDKPLAVVNMGPNATQAKNVIFSGIVNFLNGSEWFQNFDYDAKSGVVNFFKKRRFSKRLDPQRPNLAIYCGNSKETMPVGLNVYAWVIDEFAFFLDTEEKSNAKEVRDMLRNRQTSRFGLKAGLAFTISSARYEGDVMDSLYKNNLKMHGVDVYCTKKKTWEVKDPKKMSEKTFDFVAKYDDEGKPSVVWENIPIDFRKSSTENPEKFMRDFACVPSLTLEPFDRDAQVIVRNRNNDRENPLREDGSFKDWFYAEHTHPCFFHIDLAKNKDACGISIGHQEGFVEIPDEEGGKSDKVPRVVADLIMRITAPKGGEILFSDVRQVLYSMKERGFRIKMGTFDGWQSIDSIQILNKRGIKTELFSIDRTTEAYDTLKSLLHLNAIDYYPYEVRLADGEKAFILEKEYMNLEMIKSKKVDHPEGGSKDVTDSFSGMVRNVVKHAKTKPGMTII